MQPQPFVIATTNICNFGSCKGFTLFKFLLFYYQIFFFSYKQGFFVIYPQLQFHDIFYDRS